MSAAGNRVHCPFNIRSADVEVRKEPNKALICSRVSAGQREHECVVIGECEGEETLHSVTVCNTSSFAGA